jgi:hypothetical protein
MRRPRVVDVAGNRLVAIGKPRPRPFGEGIRFASCSDRIRKNPTVRCFFDFLVLASRHPPARTTGPAALTPAGCSGMPLPFLSSLERGFQVVYLPASPMGVSPSGPIGFAMIDTQCSRRVRNHLFHVKHVGAGLV